MLDHPSQESAVMVLAALQDHFHHEEQLMRACEFGGQGPLSGFQSHCNHHQIILDQFQSVKDMLPPKTQRNNPLSGAATSALQQAVRLFYGHADMYDSLYEGRVHG
ncbi:hypothetical protein DUNSADRAFT_8184 [Dunaliella salina]|uniref:Hemerythrin-like domain-containing protein n=1 Tax=Dunaliella salina TaxID=3046 RepID=A0ABQ7FSZ1_DUNSA|nr:hypothetical protein DUNSADRAFT_8184 [Dunaliella salina]|eukprot:KAF5825600.1 hypothetical protein DUNSADRAFT_8184 [Dunaliella salina]